MRSNMRNIALLSALSYTDAFYQAKARADASLAETQAYRLSIRDPKTIVRDWVEDAKKKNGRRPHVCDACKMSFLGNKKRKLCFDCEVTIHIPIPSYDESADDALPEEIAIEPSSINTNQ